MTFETDYKTILGYIDTIDPLQYAKTRNYVDGAVTKLSPYISRGVISTKQVLAAVLQKGYQIAAIEFFVKELCWRDYFQRVAQVKNINLDIKQTQKPVVNFAMSVAALNAATGIAGIDESIKQLYQTGYMHNHCRMYTASLVCNVGQSHWLQPAQWMYYYLLDGDWASNACSWQWVAGANSSKKYYANQANINKYTCTNQSGTYLDIPYEDFAAMQIPALLLDTQKFIAETKLPDSGKINIDSDLPIFIYNYYNLDPVWHKDEPGNRILLIEPDFFAQYPVSKKCMSFMLELSKNINTIQVYVGSFKSFTDKYDLQNIYYKEHPFNKSYTGIEEARDWISESVKGYHPSFFTYWKKVEGIFKNL